MFSFVLKSKKYCDNENALENLDSCKEVTFVDDKLEFASIARVCYNRKKR